MEEERWQERVKEVEELVGGFRKNLRSLRDEQVVEAVIRQEYIDAFWKLLGWDVANREHRSAAQKDVVIERTVGTVEGDRFRSRRPDYIFRIGGFARFIVEAKKPGVDLDTDRDAIFQAKTYAWNAQIPFAVLTNFEQFRLFDATVKPYHDQPQRGAIAEFDLGYEDYVSQWDVLWKTFGRESVGEGSLEALLGKIKRVAKGRRIRGIDRMLVDLRGSEPVDRVFLAHLEEYRLRFARTIYSENKAYFPEADTRHGAAKLTEATQRLIDRLVFMRVCEDRDITSYGELRDIVNNAAENRLDLYLELVGRFRRFDEEYNGYLFKPNFSENLRISGELLAEFIRSLYMPEGPYRFDAIGDDLLGIIYERFLGSTITVTQGYVEAEEKPEVRHAGGVYYTPRFVVDTIIRRVVGPKIEGKTPLEVLDVKILDPACGSGSFLIAALQYLFDYCARYVAENPKAAVAPASSKARKKTREIAFEDGEGNWHLTPLFRSELLASCIYGVDIDAQAAEVTIMSLYLKMLEGKLPPNWQREFLRSRLLPSLDNNICCGNSLLSQTDFDRYWEDKYADLFGGDEELKFRMNAFDWNSRTRGFGRLLEEKGGFDCIIGNPPYIRVQELKKWAGEECEFYKKQYKSAAKGNYDIYVVFIEKGLTLLATEGLMGYICPHKFWKATYGREIRRLLTGRKHVKAVVDFTDQQVFRGATTYTAIHVFCESGHAGAIDYSGIKKLIDGETQCRTLEAKESFSSPEMLRIEAMPLPTEGDMWTFLQVGSKLIRARPEINLFKLDDVVEFSQGFKTGADKVFVVEVLREKNGLATVRSEATGREHSVEVKMLRPLIKSEHMRRFEIRRTALGLVFPYVVGKEKWRIFEPEEIADKFPKAWSEYLKPLESLLDERESGRFSGRYFYQYSRQQNFVPLHKAKLITPDMADRMRFSFDRSGEFVFSGGAAGGVGMIPKGDLSPHFLLGILNSMFIEDLVRTMNGVGFRGGYLNCEIRFLRDIPIQLPVTAMQKGIAERISERSEKICESKALLSEPRISDGERERLLREIEAHEARIDELVCELYGVDEIPD